MLWTWKPQDASVVDGETTPRAEALIAPATAHRYGQIVLFTGYGCSSKVWASVCCSEKYHLHPSLMNGTKFAKLLAHAYTIPRLVNQVRLVDGCYCSDHHWLPKRRYLGQTAYVQATRRL